MIKGNKGEWSELYVFARLLGDGILHQSDILLQKDPSNYYQIIKAYRKQTDAVLEYSRSEVVEIERVNESERELLGQIEIEYFNEYADKILQGINAGSGKSFEIDTIEDFIKRININKLTALTKSKSDIKLRIYDHRLAVEADLGFSIKSMLGQDSTLFNTGPGNNFIYNVNCVLPQSVDDFNRSTYKPSGRMSKITKRLTCLNDIGANITFDEIQSKKLWLNLKMVDGDLPHILAYALLYRWLDGKNTLRFVADKLEERDPLNFYSGQITEQRLYENKIQRFLTECAMGMTSETPWLGSYDANGGVIIVKQDGDIVCFHIYDFNLFREYLINNTMFEQPSTGEDEDNPGHERKGSKKYYYGWLFEENNELKFKINLQVRFK